MPIYVFRCASCLSTVEKIQSYDAGPPDCASGRRDCFGSPMERIPAASNWQLGEGKKGSPTSEAIKRVKALKHQ